MDKVWSSSLPLFILLTFLINIAFSATNVPYNQENIGQNTFYKKDDTGETTDRPVATDEYGNAQGNQYDLAQDGGFQGYRVAVLQLYAGADEPASNRGGFDFSMPKKALEEKGFEIQLWREQPPTPEVLQEALREASQLWVISDRRKKLNDRHVQVIKAFFDSGKGVYVWGDNHPYYEDANTIAKALFGTGMSGNVRGDQVVGLQRGPRAPGLLPGHLITTGLQHLYEGVTIATIQANNGLEPLIIGSAGNVVAATYEREGKRAILDGGFTRLYMKWDTAGTGRYVKNAAAWLVNYERFAQPPEDISLSSRSMEIDGQTVRGVCLVAALLTEVGYFQGDFADTTYENVEDALRAFQADLGDTPSGSFTGESWERLKQVELGLSSRSKVVSLCN